MGKGKFRQWLEWAAHVETIHTIVQTEFVRTLLWPTVVTIMTAVAGYLGNFPVMWVLMAAALAFMGTVTGLLRASEYIERKNPLNKLKILQPAVAVDLVPAPTPNRQQRRSGQPAQQLPVRHIDKIQLGVEVRNDATFPISILIESAETEVEGETPPRAKFPKGPTTIVPGMVIRACDDAIPMNNMPCQKMTGKIDMKIKYGLPGKENFEIHARCNLEIQMQPFGLITQIGAAWEWS